MGTLTQLRRRTSRSSMEVYASHARTSGRARTVCRLASPPWNRLREANLFLQILHRSNHRCIHRKATFISASTRSDRDRKLAGRILRTPNQCETDDRRTPDNKPVGNIAVDFIQRKIKTNIRYWFENKFTKISNDSALPYELRKMEMCFCTQ